MQPALGLALALVATAAAYHGVARAGFVYDDLALIEQNPSVRSFSNVGDWFARSFWRDAYNPADADRIPYYRPMVTCVLAVGHALGGGAPAAHHLVVLALHLAVTAAVFALARRFLAPFGATVAALAFGLIPVHVESVAWISGLSDVTASFFGLGAALTLFAARDARDRGARASSGAMSALSAVLMLLAFLTKESALAFPFIVAALDVWARPAGARRTIAPYLGYAAAAAVYLALRVRVFGSARAGFDLRPTDFGIPDWRYATLPFELFARYLGKLLEPFRLNAFRPLRVDLEPTSAPVIAGVAATAAFGALLIAVFLGARRRPAMRVPLAALAAMTVAILPMVANPRGIGHFVFCERFLYLPSLGFAWLVGWIADAAFARSRPAALAGAALLLGAYAWRTMDRVPVWRDEETLFEQSKIDSPDSATVRRSLGRVYLEKFQSNPDRALVDRALEEFKASIDDERCRRVFVSNDDAVQGPLGIAWCHLILGRPALALGVADQVIERFPNTEEAHALAGVAAAQVGNAERALQSMRRAIEIRPNFARAHANLGHFHLMRGEFAQAATALQDSLKVEPSNAEVRMDLARALSGLNREDEARALVEQVERERKR